MQGVGADACNNCPESGSVVGNRIVDGVPAAAATLIDAEPETLPLSFWYPDAAPPAANDVAATGSEHVTVPAVVLPSSQCDCAPMVVLAVANGITPAACPLTMPEPEPVRTSSIPVLLGSVAALMMPVVPPAAAQEPIFSESIRVDQGFFLALGGLRDRERERGEGRRVERAKLEVSDTCASVCVSGTERANKRATERGRESRASEREREREKEEREREGE